jgi:hypothetical protein
LEWFLWCLVKEWCLVVVFFSLMLSEMFIECAAFIANFLSEELIVSLHVILLSSCLQQQCANMIGLKIVWFESGSFLFLWCLVKCLLNVWAAFIANLFSEELIVSLHEILYHHAINGIVPIWAPRQIVFLLSLFCHILPLIHYNTTLLSLISQIYSTKLIFNQITILTTKWSLITLFKKRIGNSPQ